MVRPLALCFDLDGTLLDNSGMDGALRLACADIAKRRPGLTAEAVLAANGEAWRTFWPEVEATWILGGLSGKSVSLEAWRITLLACGCDDPAIARFARERHAMHERKAQRLFADAKTALDRLPDSVPLALITNGASDTQRDKLSRLGLSSRFQAIAISGEVGAAKPSPSIFAAALEGLGVRPEDAWHVGDNLATDVGGANAAGMRSVWVNREAQPTSTTASQPHHEIASLTELLELITA